MTKYSLLIVIILLIFACKKQEELKPVKINEIYQTERNETDNVDSPAFWQGPNGENRLIATAKETDKILVYNAEDGKFIKETGTEGTAPGQLDRPNGIFVIDDICLVVERDNKRVQVFSLPGLEHIGFIGENLVKPYGLFVYGDKTGYNMYVTDNYETADEQIPPDSDLGRRIHIYTFNMNSGELKSKFVKAFGDTAGEGTLRVVESIWGDPVNNILYIAEENEPETCVKIYDLEGTFTGKVLGKGMFKYQVEGISLYKNGDTGCWIVTDQDYNNNTFYLFERISDKLIGSFTGPKTTNTDGIWLTQKSFGQFKEGAFFAIHNDGNVSAFDWGAVKSAVKIK